MQRDNSIGRGDLWENMNNMSILKEINIISMTVKVLLAMILGVP